MYHQLLAPIRRAVESVDLRTECSRRETGQGSRGLAAWEEAQPSAARTGYGGLSST